jgi:[ribosomal protein S5]-alanine N-acetyltransferase
MFAVLSDPAIYEFENAPPASEQWLRERFAKLESRASADGTELWLNWVVKLPTGKLAGFVQATVRKSGVAYVAYELASKYWRQGIGSCAVRAMLDELAGQYNVHTFLAVLKATNFRSLALLRHLGFSEGSPEQVAASAVDPDELLMVLQRPGAPQSS